MDDETYLQGECLKAAATLLAGDRITGSQDQLVRATVDRAKQLYLEATRTPWVKGTAPGA